MRNCLFVVLLAGLISACTSSGKPDNIVVTFDVKNPTATEVVLVYHRTINSVPLNEQGYGADTISGVNALYANLFYGQNERKIYLEKGDRVHITFDGNDYVGTFKFEGEKAPVIDYLNTVTLTSLPDETYALPLNEYMQKVEQKEQEAYKLLNVRGLDGIGNFNKMEAARIHYSYGTGVVMYPMGHIMMTQDSTYRPDEAYYDTLRKYMVEDEDWLDMDEYRDFVVELSHILDTPNREVTDYYPKTVAQMRYIADNFKNERVKEVLLNSLAAEYVERFGIKNITDLENIYHTYVKDTVLLADYQDKYEKWNLSSPGKPSPDFQAVDINGKSYSLADFKGKYLYIDLWATWCGPCQRELPFLKKLESKFEGKNITFLSLSIDHDKAKWEAKVNSGDLSGVQLLIGRGSSFQRAYNIEGIPRFLLLDKEGKIINNDMLRPSSDDTERILNTLEGI